MKQNPIFKYSDFRKLFISRIISAIGDKFFSLSLVWFVISNYQGGYYLSLIMSAIFLPSVIFSPIMGTISDRYNKKTLMIIADLLRFLFLLILFIILSTDNLSFKILFLAVFLNYTFSPLFETSTASSLKILTSDDDLPQATAIDSASIGISNVVGAALGSIFIAIIGFKGCVLINIIAYFISFIFVYSIKRKLIIKSERQSSYFNDLKDGFLYIKNKKNLILKLLILFGILNFFVSPILMLIPVIVKFILEREVNWLAIIETFFAIGTFLASYILSYKKDINKNIEYLMITIIIFAISFLATSYIKTAYLTTFLIFICGFSISAGNVLILSYFQKNIDDEYKGRFFSLINTIVYAIMPLSFVFNGLLIEKITIKYTIIFNSLFALIIGLYGSIKFRSKNFSS